MPEAISELLVKWNDGDGSALERLRPIVYEELRRLARSRLRREHRALTLEPTVLVHETYLRLVDQKSVAWQNRAQFFGLAARLMRNILVDLVDHRRKHGAAKRGGEALRVSLSRADRLMSQHEVRVLALDDALKDLNKFSPVRWINGGGNCGGTGHLCRDGRLQLELCKGMARSRDESAAEVDLEA